MLGCVLYMTALEDAIYFHNDVCMYQARLVLAVAPVDMPRNSSPSDTQVAWPVSDEAFVMTRCVSYTLTASASVRATIKFLDLRAIRMC